MTPLINQDWRRRTMNMLTCSEAIWITLLVEYDVDNWSCRYSVGIVVSCSGGNIGLWNRLYWRGSYKYLVNNSYASLSCSSYSVGNNV